MWVSVSCGSAIARQSCLPLERFNDSFGAVTSSSRKWPASPKDFPACSSFRAVPSRQIKPATDPIRFHGLYSFGEKDTTDSRITSGYRVALYSNSPDARILPANVRMRILATAIDLCFVSNISNNSDGSRRVIRWKEADTRAFGQILETVAEKRFYAIV